MKDMGRKCVNFLTNLIYPTSGKLSYPKPNKNTEKNNCFL